MSRILADAQGGRAFWLMVLLAVALLLGVSTTAARAEAVVAAGIERDLGALHVLSEGLADAPPAAVRALVHPALADGSGSYLKNASLRRIAALQKRLATLDERVLADPPGAGPRQTLAHEALRLHWLLLTLPDDAPAPLDLAPTLQRMSVAWARLIRPDAAPPRILRGTTL